MVTLRTNPIICALDGMNTEKIVSTIGELGRSVWGYKLSASILRGGVATIKEIEEKTGYSINWFLDLQLIGTPGFIRESVSILSRPGVRYISINAASGHEGIRAAVENARFSRILVSSILSSLGIVDIKFVFETTNREVKICEFARMTQECGAAGMFFSSEELEFLSRYPETLKMEKVSVGIRPLWHKDHGDHKRVLTPKAAIDLGATFLVIGEPITKAANKKEAAERILSEL